MDDIVRYVPGQPIDTSKVLEVVDLSPEGWEPIERIYPEVKAAGPAASFRDKHNVTIFPPERVSSKHLRWLSILGIADPRVYPYYEGDELRGVLVHVRGGYASVHIYRSR